MFKLLEDVISYNNKSKNHAIVEFPSKFCLLMENVMIYCAIIELILCSNLFSRNTSSIKFSILFELENVQIVYIL